GTVPVRIDGIEPGLVAQAGTEGERPELDAQAPYVRRQLLGLWRRSRRAAEENPVAAEGDAREARRRQGRLSAMECLRVAEDPFLARQPHDAVRLREDRFEAVRRHLDERARNELPA